MIDILKRNSAPLISLFVFVLGNGFFATFLASNLAHRQVSSLFIGLMTTSLYFGLVIGSFKIEKLISKVSHIRAYAAFASGITVIALCHSINDNIYFWLILRFFAGFATAGVFVVIESWLLCQSSISTRGQILSFYMVTFYASQALGQLFLKLDVNDSVYMFTIIAISSSLSVIPLSLTSSAMPAYGEPSTLTLKEIYKACVSGLFGCFISGMILGAIYGLFPVFIIKTFLNTDSVANVMFAIIMGGMALQYPIGKLSDVIERRIVLLVIGLVGLSIVLAMLFVGNSVTTFLILCAFFGGFTFTIYPVSISHACDNLEPEHIVSGTQTLLLAYSIGAMVGPVIASLFMKYAPWGLQSYFLVTLSMLVIILGWRKTVKENTEQEENYISYPSNTPIICEIDPRAENLEDPS